MAVKYWTGQTLLQEFDYDGGLNTPVVGETLNIDGAEGVDTAVIQSWTVTSGSWGGNNAAGKMWVYLATSTFIANLTNNSVIENSGATKICDTTGGVTDKEGDWQTAGNWGTGEGVAVPLADNAVIFDGRSSTAPDEGMLDSESGATAQCTFDLLHFKPSYTAGVASAAEPLCCGPDKIIIEGTGTYYILIGKDNQSTDVTVPAVIVNNKAATVYLYSNANDGANTCEITNLYVLAGTIYLSFYSVDTDDQGVYVANLYSSPRNNKSSNVTISIAKDCYKVNGTVAMNIYMLSGAITTDSMIGIIDMYGGTLNYGTDLAAGPETDLNITTARIYNGDFNWYPDDSGDDAYIGALYLFGGTFSSSSTTNNNRAKVLGNGAGLDIFVYEGAVLNIANNMGNITVNGSSQLWNFGGDVITDSGSQIAISYDQP